MKDGYPVLKELNDEYYENFKEDREIMVYTGFRIWKNNSKSDYTASADGGGVIYRLTDWSSQITYPEEEEDKTDAGTKKKTPITSSEM